MAFKDLLIGKLKNKLPESKLILLPKGYQKVGHLVIFNFVKGLEDYWKDVGNAVMEIDKSVKTVCAKVGEISGEFRRPQIKFIVGENNLIVENFENGVWFKYDASKIMFAKGNVSERGRLPKIVNEGEIIVDMFIGIGYFSVPIAKLANPKIIYGIDLNLDSIYWLNETIKKNKLSNIEVIKGDSKVEVVKLVEKGIVADRVLMGYLPPPREFIPSALKIVKSGGMIHYDALIRSEHKEEDFEEVLNLFRKEGREVELINPQKVKSYGPKIDHYVLDIKVF